MCIFEQASKSDYQLRYKHGIDFPAIGDIEETVPTLNDQHKGAKVSALGSAITHAKIPTR
ncbi:hypothetical protein [Nostoc sp.]|uniref:hypothetical protein n=1 Tax=Nostoc sp. TaxID=1180 RepID=UPI002FFD0BB4